MKYILVNKKIVPVDLMTWAKWFEKGDRIVKQEYLKNGLRVSTVFLGIDYSFGGAKPLLFETMVFPSEENFSELDIERYSTYRDAEKGHKRMVKKWK